MLDVVGDIHGCYEELHTLLEKLGYKYDEGNHFFYHTGGRKIVFIGDIIDGGRENIKSICLVQNMVSRDHAYIIAGNHEFNAVMYATPNPAKDGEFFRRHTDENRKQHETYLAEVGHDSILYDKMTQWFKSLPVYLQIGNAKFAHACWYQKAIDYLEDGDFLDDKGALNEKGWAAATDRSSQASEMVELLLKGPEETLPNGQTYPDIQGVARNKARVSWWHQNPTTNEDAYSSIPECDFLKDAFDNAQVGSIREKIIKEIKSMPKNEAIFFGHISRLDDPDPLSDKVICVDYGIKKGKQIVAWSMHDVMEPTKGHFVSVAGRALQKQKRTPVPA